VLFHISVQIDGSSLFKSEQNLIHVHQNLLEINIDLLPRQIYHLNTALDIDIDIFFNCNCVDTHWQQYSTHSHTNSTQNNTIKQNTQNGTYTTIRIHKLQN
jgi:hypothetical protein